MLSSFLSYFLFIKITQIHVKAFIENKRGKEREEILDSRKLIQIGP